MHFARKFRLRRLSDIQENKLSTSQCRLVNFTPLDQQIFIPCRRRWTHSGPQNLLDVSPPSSAIDNPRTT
ncbi:hypothetical protein RRG08_039776 [Elysia crispata]|uniref:Uncharacterized protein n=1 Tax=Elysia crispata TaxID=231223 RepID=A0AAE0ZUY7_9GAST|nr:hypothetical protein RRG08_039776 [Elysia crispata]